MYASFHFMYIICVNMILHRDITGTIRLNLGANLKNIK